MFYRGFWTQITSPESQTISLIKETWPLQYFLVTPAIQGVGIFTI